MVRCLNRQYDKIDWSVSHGSPQPAVTLWGPFPERRAIHIHFCLWAHRILGRKARQERHPLLRRACLSQSLAAPRHAAPRLPQRAASPEWLAAPSSQSSACAPAARMQLVSRSPVGGQSIAAGRAGVMQPGSLGWGDWTGTRGGRWGGGERLGAAKTRRGLYR